MENVKIKQTEWLQMAKQYIAAANHSVIYATIDSPVVLVYKKTQVDEDTCNSLGYEIYESYYNGGTLVANRGDVAFAHFYNIKNGWRERFVEYFVTWLKNKGLNATYDNNDILVDGYKVTATCVTRYGRIDYTTIFVGINTNIDHIKQICKKPMVKVPKGLSEYGITTQEIEQMFLEFCEQDSENNK